MVKRRAVIVFSMVVVALIAAGCVSSAPESASHTIALEPTSNTIKTDGLYRAKTDAPICETHDELVTAAYEYDGGHTPDVSGCTALAKGEEVKVLAPKVADDLNAVQVNTQGHIGWTKSYYLDEPAVKSN
jgi:ABC-type nitrate/sulfonate/bicarbonate transport system substrate-binding protein